MLEDMLMNDESEAAGEGVQTALAETPAAKNEAPAAEERNENGNKNDDHIATPGDGRPEENGGGEKKDDTPKEKETPLEQKEAEEVQAGNE